MLKELKAAGAVVEQPKGIFRPLTRSSSRSTWARNRYACGAALSAISQARSDTFHPCEPKIPALFERRAINLTVDTTALPAFREFLESEGQAFLERVDDWLAAHVKRGSDGDGKAMRLGVGIYQIQDDPSEK